MGKATKKDIKPKASAKAASKPIKKADKEVEKKGKTTSSGKLLEVGLLCDCTSSMWTWIDRAKKTLQEIITNVTSSTEGLKVRVCFIGYRDHCDVNNRFSIHNFTEDVAGIRDFIAKVQATGGGDLPEDVVGGIRKCLD